MEIEKPAFDFNRKKPEELLEILRAYQTAINVNIISSVTDSKGTILYANDKFCEISKYEKHELIGQNHRIINSGFHPHSFFNEMWSTIASGKPWHGEIKNKAKDGTFYWVDTVILPIKTNHSGITQYLSLRSLITEKKNLEDQMKEYTEKLHELLHITSHRVRSPLTRCLGIIGLIESDQLLSEEELQKVISHLKSSALELDQFTRELTTYMDTLEKKYKQILEARRTNLSGHKLSGL